MAASTLQAVWDDLLTALAAIREEDGYHRTVQTVTSDLVSTLGLSPTQTPALVILPDGERSSRIHRLGAVVEDTIAFALEGRVDAPGVTSVEMAHAYADLVADVERAVTRDVTRGGAACWTRVNPPVGPFFGPPSSGVVLWQQRIDVIAVRTVGAS